MNKLILLAAVIAVSLVACTKKQQSVNSAADCSDLKEERDRLADKNAELRSLAKRRQAIYDELRRELAELIDSGKLKLVFRRGMIVLQLPDQILFQSGKAVLKSEGKETVLAVGEAIVDIEDRRFLVAGHTDNRPIKASQWKSNWRLSSARAQIVLKVLIDAGVSPSQLAAAGFGEHDPMDSNDTEEGMSQNRRTEIMVVPDLEQIFSTIKGASGK